MLNFPANIMITKDNIVFAKKKISFALFSFLNNPNIQENLVNHLTINKKINLIFDSKVSANLLENLENIFSTNNIKINGVYICNKFFKYKIKPEDSYPFFFLIIICFFFLIFSFQYLKNYSNKQNIIINNLNTNLAKLNTIKKEISEKKILTKTENNKKYFETLNMVLSFPILIKKITINPNIIEIIGYMDINQITEFLSDFDAFSKSSNLIYSYNFEKVNEQFIKTNIKITL